ncbi:uncharacterized protein LOC111273985 isoform X2 [Varroa jacobsoni]|uniref:uncharacterized protein LOC111273985 isoform X2 n=1 Tax=Varroa jacobsoni TaxID=62625 RepID=UPI000BF74B4E|nr:uncharacterized protein LOC111273985 isoform X2 [Varroa jacobsoni]
MLLTTASGGVQKSRQATRTDLFTDTCEPVRCFQSAMKVLATFSIVIVCARAAHIGTYTSTYQSPVHYSIQTPSYSNQALVHAQVPVASASGAPAVYRTPFVNRNGVVSRNPDAVWNDPVEHIPFAPTPVPGSEFLIYGDPGYGAYRGNFGGVSLNSGLYGYKSKKSAKA